MKNADSEQRPKIDLLAMKCWMGSKPFREWVYGHGEQPAIHSRENITKIIDVHIGSLARLSADLVTAKEAIEAGNWVEVHRIVHNAFRLYAPSDAQIHEILDLIATAGSDTN